MFVNLKCQTLKAIHGINSYYISSRWFGHHYRSSSDMDIKWYCFVLKGKRVGWVILYIPMWAVRVFALRKCCLNGDWANCWLALYCRWCIINNVGSFTPLGLIGVKRFLHARIIIRVCLTAQRLDHKVKSNVLSKMHNSCRSTDSSSIGVQTQNTYVTICRIIWCWAYMMSQSNNVFIYYGPLLHDHYDIENSRKQNGKYTCRICINDILCTWNDSS